MSLVVGAGGPTGGPFIWAALEALEHRTRWRASSAHEIIGTSAGAFVSASFNGRSEPVAGSVDALIEVANGHLYPANQAVRGAAALRRFAGRLIARFAPLNKEIAAYNVPDAPFHPGATAVTVRRAGTRVEHHLADANDVEAVVRASAAIPGLNQPIEVDGVLHVDGAVHSATNTDLVREPDVIVVIAPMIPASGGTVVARFHRAQLRAELAKPLQRGVPVVVVMPSEAAHAERRDREPFATEGAAAVARL